MKSKVTQFIEYLMLHPKRSYQQMQQFFYKLNHPDRDIKTMSNGYYCTNIQTLVYRKIIRKDKNKLYYVTVKGIKNKNKPYGITDKEKLDNKILNACWRYHRKCTKQQRDYENQSARESVKRSHKRGYYNTVGDLICLLKTLPFSARVTLAIDEEINATGNIYKQVAVDNYDNVNEVTFLPINVELTA